MRRASALGALALLLVAPLAAGGSWLQPRGDAAATGFQPGSGPEHPDVAMRVELNGSRQPEADAPPLVLEDRILFLARENNDAYDGTYQVYSLELATGNVTTVGEIGVSGRLTMATDGDTVYATGFRTIRAFPLGPDGASWTWRWENRTPAEDRGVSCLQMTIDHGYVTVLCYDVDEVEGEDVGDSVDFEAGLSDVTLVVRLDADTGEAAWVWEKPGPNTTQQGRPATRAVPQGLAVAGGQVLVQAIEGNAAGATASAETPAPEAFAGGFAARGRIVVHALDAQDGSPAWPDPWESPPFNVTAVPAPAGDPAGVQNLPRLIAGNPAASDDTLYVKAQGIRALNLGTGEEKWFEPVGEEDTQPGFGGGTGLVFGDGQVHATTAQTVYGIDAEAHDDRWTKSLSLSANEGFDEEPIATPDTVYAATTSNNGTGSVYAFSPEDGDIRWEHPATDGMNSYSVGNGLVAITEVELGEEQSNTTLVVLGETEASPDPAASPSTTYPDQGEQVRVDLSDSGAGLQGPVTRYKAVWGDGNVTGWQEDPVLSHTYGSSGDQTARFVVGNDAGQTASTTETFHVGEDPPPDPNFAQEAAQQALAPGNVDITFGLLGLFVAATGGAVGAARRYRKRSRLQQELDALEQGFAETRNDPGECEAFLDTRKGRARSLALDGKLNEEQAGIIESRAEELRRELRQGAVEGEFGFLPYELVEKARKMLEDGEVTELEAEAFLAALEDVDFLREEQEALVRERIEDWYGRDAGGGGGVG